MISWCRVEPCASRLSLENASCVCVCVCVQHFMVQTALPQLKSSRFCRQPQVFNNTSAETETVPLRCDFPLSALKHQLSLMSEHLTPVCQSTTYLIRSHWHSAHSHGVHAHLALHLAMSLSWHLAHLSWTGPADWPRSTNGVVHHHGSKLALITLLRKLLLGVRARKQKKRQRFDIIPLSNIQCI